jgi:hypothetical protein
MDLGEFEKEGIATPQPATMPDTVPATTPTPAKEPVPA